MFGKSNKKNKQNLSKRELDSSSKAFSFTYENPEFQMTIPNQRIWTH